MDSWCVDSGATTHISMSLQGCLWSCSPTDAERFIYVGNELLGYYLGLVVI